jgi:hypothetical protein
MSLMRLLSMGHCVSEATSGNPYRVAKESYLPSYGVGNVPITSPARTGQATKPAAREPISAASAKPSWRRRAAAGFTALKIQLPGRRWLRKSNPFAAGKSGGKTISQSPPASSQSVPAQAELSLDKVKVMRNDLSVADGEAMLKPAAKSASPVSGPENAKPWNRLATKFFGSS